MRRNPIVRTVLALALVACAPLAFAQEGAPRAEPLDPIKDFEVVAKGEVLHHAFQIRNSGSSVLEVTDVRPACGCTVADYDRSIAPGETGEIRIQVKTDNFAGPISKTVAVFTNDTDNAKLQLVVKADVKPYITVLPGFARYNYVQGEPVETVPQTIWAETEENLEILAVNSPSDALKVTYREATEEERNPKGQGRQWRLEFTLSENAPVGALRDYVTVELNHPKQQLAKIPISGFVRPRQHVTPASGDFGQVGPELLPQTRTLHFTNFGTDGIELTEIDTGLSGLEAEVVPSENQPGHRFKVVLTLNEQMPVGSFDSVIKIHTTDSKNPVVEVPVKGAILDADTGR